MNIFNTVNLKQIIWKTKMFFKMLEYPFLVESTKIENASVPYKKPMLRQIAWWVKVGSITKNRVLPITTLIFWKYYFSLGTFYKKLIWCAKDPNAEIRTFCKCCTFVLGCFFLLSILKSAIIVNSVNAKAPIHSAEQINWLGSIWW